MKMVYCNENSFLVNNVRNLLEAEQINTFLKNEFSQGAVGEVSATDAWPEVWIVNNTDFYQAMKIVHSSQQAHKGSDWVCADCEETNNASFEICWHCQGEHPQR
ncbi:zinc-finger-like domain-containing protein [Psychromonas marina]|uniref:Zinc-finger-like domain-containing protein n=1 Tax=Psychromonas marina TaxID=88364 RepID=A0ABQ6E1Y0_9GAMM|nr:DUF2007 domain-containing protein [Psychromonas marina]GLS91371.1 zinc-finger-like domain-containing protein [Psychromonas marina]